MDYFKGKINGIYIFNRELSKYEWQDLVNSNSLWFSLSLSWRLKMFIYKLWFKLCSF